MAEMPLNRVVRHLRSVVSAGENNKLPDEELLKRFAGSRNEAAFGAIVRRYGPLVLGICQRVLGDWHEAEDTFQATFFVLARKAQSIQKKESLGNWLYGVAYRLALKARNSQAKKRLQQQEAARARPERSIDDITVRELRMILDEELYRLPDKYRAPLLLCCLEGKTQDEAARLLGWTAGSVRGRLERGRDLLRTRLVRRGLTLSLGLLASALAQNSAAASVSPLLAAVTARAAVVYGAGQTAAAGGLISIQVAASANGFLKGMAMTKLKIATAIILGIGIIGPGSGLVAHQVLSGNGNDLGGTPTTLKKEATPRPQRRQSTTDNSIRRVAKATEAEKDRALAANLLAGRKIRLIFKDTPVADALAEFSKQTGFRLDLEGDPSKLADRKITLDTGEATLWEVLDQFCKKAGLEESWELTLARSQAKGRSKRASDVKNKRPTMEQNLVQGITFSALSLVVAIDGKPQNVPTYVAGGMRIRALPAPNPMPKYLQEAKKDGKTVVVLEVTAEPKLDWRGVLDVRIDKAVDDRGQELAKTPNTFEGLPFWDPEMEFSTGNAKNYPLLLQKGKEPATVLKELKGVIVAQVQSKPEALATVENILKAKGRTMSCSNGLGACSLKVVEAVRNDNGEVRVHLVIRNLDAPTIRTPFLTFAIHGLQSLKPSPAEKEGAQKDKGSQLEKYQVALEDGQGKMFDLTQTETPDLQRKMDDKSDSMDMILTYRPQKGQGKPAKLVLIGSRVVKAEIPFALKDIPLGKD